MRSMIAALLFAATASGAPVEMRGGVALMPNDDTISPFNRPFNLTGRSVTFTRTGAETFSSRTGPLQFEEDRGARIALDRTAKSSVYTLGFDFPFFGAPVRTLHLSQLLAIYLDVPPPPPPLTVLQWSEAELLSHARPVIAPLLTTTRGQGTFLPPNVFVRETADRLIVTWYEETRPLEIQAVLFAAGDIRFSYRNIAYTRGGALLITNGTEPARQRHTVAEAAATARSASAAATKAAATASAGSICI